MRSKVRSRITYANVIATIALFIALGGGAYAALRLPANSVGTAQIKSNAVVSSKVKDGSLLSQDFKAGQLPAGPQGAQGAQGPQGAQGLQGPQGAQGTQGQKGDTGTVDTSNFYTKGESDGRFLAQNRLQSSTFTALTAGAAPVTLLTRGPVTFTATCTDLNLNDFRVEVSVTSTEAGTIGHQSSQDDLSSTPTVLATIDSDATVFRSNLPVAIITSSTGFHTMIAYGVHAGGHDCVAGVVATP
jgi:hypothetical protein